ncbi:MAG: HAD family hydrolase [Thiothrix sp.]|nr:MAG: HAD family hydrolase [Thiothrix sp.]
MNDKKPFDVLIFDWDGTLMDSEAHIITCLEVAMREVGVKPGPAEELKQVIGLGLFEALAALMPEEDAAVHQQATEAYRGFFLAGDATPSELFPGVESTLQQLHHEGFVLAVATGKSRRGLEKVMRQTQLDVLFSISRCADESFSKPHPKMLEEILTDLDTSAQRALMVGDTEFDLQMAANIGMPSLAVSYGVHDIERLQAHKPLAIIDHMEDLPEWLDSYSTN